MIDSRHCDEFRSHAPHQWTYRGEVRDCDGSPLDGWRLTEDQTRAKAIELLEACNSRRMDGWIFSGVSSGVLDPDIVERVLTEELPGRSHEVRHYWLGPCTQCLHPSAN